MRFCKYCGAPLAKDAGPAAAVLDRKITRPETPSALATPAPPSALASEPGRVGPVAGGAAARLVAIAKDGSEGTSWALSGETVDVGRDEGDIRLADDAFVSPRHLRLTRRSDGWHLHDLASVNGVYLRVRKPTPLVDQDLILVGLQVLRFEVVKEAEQGLGPAIQHGTQLFGSPIVPRHARLCQRSVEGITRNVFHLQRDETVIGREAGDLVFTDDPFLSRRHVTIRRDPASKAFTIEDLGSSNGTYLAMKGDVLLADGDFVRVGQHLFRFDLGGASGASPAWRSA
jgi:pSer/pThr/pTyr-binding forkhead associated (FHA) protein